MTTLTVEAVRIKPGSLFFYSLDVLLRTAKASDASFDAWGVCRRGDLFWFGEQGCLEKTDVFLVSLLDVLEQRSLEYVGWGAEEVLFFIGLDWSGRFTWFLLNREEYKRREEQIGQPPLLS